MQFKVLKIIAFFLFVTSSHSQPLQQYSGKLIDAHSQIRCDMNPVETGSIIQAANIDYTLLSASGCNKREEYFSDMRSQHRAIAEVAKAHSKIFYMAGMKNLTAKSRWHPDKLELAFSYGRDAGLVGGAEILIQHAVWDDPRLKTNGVQLNLTDAVLEAVIAEYVKRGFPVILHIELKDSREKKEATLADLSNLLKRHAKHPFLLIHLGQATPNVAADLLKDHKNIYFLTSMASGFNQIATRGKVVVHQTGWDTFFETDGKNMRQHIMQPKWRKEWRELVSKYPDRFVLALDNVFKGNWRNRFPREILIWRRGLAQLDKKVAKQLACENAKQLWDLPVSCD